MKKRFCVILAVMLLLLTGCNTQKETEKTEMKSTFILGYCNGAYGYIPNTQAYDYGCYESHTGNFTRETGDELVQTYISVLQELQN